MTHPAQHSDTGGTVIHLVPRTGDAGPEHRAVYTVAEVAEMLSLSRGSTYALIRSGDIPALKMGARWIVPKRRFHDWLDGCRVATLEEVRRECERPDRGR